MRKRSKKYVEVSKNIENNKYYTKEEAIKLVKESNVTKFDSTVEVAIRLNVDSKKSDQQLRGSLVMPNGTGKSKKVLVIAKGALEEIIKVSDMALIDNKEVKINKEIVDSVNEKAIELAKRGMQVIALAVNSVLSLIVMVALLIVTLSNPSYVALTS